ncbi:MAG TPA: hypothetical protein VGR37_13060 [Longimicrobiaceae bacterium]|nr:hypothetical protein [Longimicrobiaceae bacterium]
MRSFWTRPDVLAFGLLVLSVALCVRVSVEAHRFEPMGDPMSAAAARPLPVFASRSGDRSEATVLAAVARDPFRPDRRRPAGRYRMPGEAVPAPPPPVQVAPSPAFAMFRVLGTLTFSDGGGAAALAGPSGQARLVRVGQSFEGMRLTRVRAGTATLVGKDTTLVLRAPEAGGTQ